MVLCCRASRRSWFTWVQGYIFCKILWWWDVDMDVHMCSRVSASLLAVSTLRTLLRSTLVQWRMVGCTFFFLQEPSGAPGGPPVYYDSCIVPMGLGNGCWGKKIKTKGVGKKNVKKGKGEKGEKGLKIIYTPAWVQYLMWDAGVNICPKYDIFATPSISKNEKLKCPLYFPFFQLFPRIFAPLLYKSSYFFHNQPITHIFDPPPRG